jgi:hypothetical protein
MSLEKLIHQGQWEAYCKTKEVKSFMADMRQRDRVGGRGIGYIKALDKIPPDMILGVKNESV